MRIRILSDLHNELDRFDPPAVDADVVVLAGDIGSGTKAIYWARETFPDRPVVFVAGNHEYYNDNLSRTALQMRWAAEDTNVHVLDNHEVVIDGVRFLGATLWTDFELFGGDMNRAHALAIAKQYMSDFSCITHGTTGWFTPWQSVLLHNQSVAWLRKKLSEPFDGSTVVVTHHAPHRNSIHPRFAKTIVTAAFVSDLEHLLGFSKLWIHGHVHDAFDYVVADTRVICNPRGYNGERSGFNPRLVVEV